MSLPLWLPATSGPVLEQAQVFQRWCGEGLPRTPWPRHRPYVAEHVCEDGRFYLLRNGHVEQWAPGKVGLLYLFDQEGFDMNEWHVGNLIYRGRSIENALGHLRDDGLPPPGGLDREWTEADVRVLLPKSWRP